MRPSPEPVHSTLMSRGEGASAVKVPCAEAVWVDAYLPAFAGMSHFSPRVRSPLMGVQLWPPLVVFQTPAVPKKRTFGSFGDQLRGCVRTLRAGGPLAGTSAAAPPRPPPGGPTFIFW